MSRSVLRTCLSATRTLAPPVLGVALLCAGCSGESESSSETPEFRPTASIQDIMLSIVDPSADAIWESVATIVTHEGTEERRPSTDEEWNELYHEAIRLVEASNLLLMDDRAVARPGFRSENPGIELEPEEIQLLIDDDRTAWIGYVGELHKVAVSMLESIEAQDADKLFDEGGPLDVACERCHRHYWYPEDTALEEIHEREGRSHPYGSADASVGAPREPGGTIRGHVDLAGKLPGNPVIRMGVDPLCAELTRDKQVVQETVKTSPDGSLANVFLRLAGDFPDTPVPQEPVVIAQENCVFAPRVVAVRAGQPVHIRNDDPLLHNLNSMSRANPFNVGQPVKGLVYETRFDAEDTMLRIRCDLHRWMTEYIGVVPHPYFDVTDLTGTFEIRDVPPGTHTLTAWHELYGTLEQEVTVEPGADAEVTFTYQAES